MDEVSSPVALLLIDVINAFDFEGSEPLVAAAEVAASRIHALSERARSSGIPVIYVNDNFGQWRSDFQSTVDACSRDDQPGHRVTQLLSPKESDYFVLKPRHSGFFATALEVLLKRLEVHTVVLAGFATNICVLLTANDAYMRNYRVIVPGDCTASNSPNLNELALEQLRLVTNALTSDSESLDFAQLSERSANLQRI